MMWWLVLIVSNYIIIGTEASPSRLLLSNVKQFFNNYVQSELKIQHIAPHHISRALNGLDSLFTLLMLPGHLSEKNLHHLTLLFDDIDYLTTITGFSMAAYLHITPRAPDSDLQRTLAVDILLHADLNIFDIGTFMESESRQFQMARVIRLLSKSGLTPYELTSLINRLDAVDSQIELENQIDQIEHKIKFLTSLPTFMLFKSLWQLVGLKEQIFDGLSQEFTRPKWFSSILVPWIRGPGLHITDNSERRIIIRKLRGRILRGITSGARIGLFPRLLYLVSRSEYLASSPRMAFLIAVVDVAVRLSSSPLALGKQSLVSLAMSIDDIDAGCLSHFFYGIEEYEKMIFDFSLSIESNYGIKMLSEYPQLFPLWSRKKADLMQRILEALSWFEFQRLGCTKKLLDLTDDQIMVVAEDLHEIASHVASQSEYMFLFNPTSWLCDFVKNPSSRSVEWIIEIQRPSILSSKITAFSGSAPLPLDIHRSINEFFGFPLRFVEMERRISRLRIQCASSIIASLKRICRSSRGLPKWILDKEAVWGVLYGAGHQRRRHLMEEGLLAFLDVLDVFLKADDAVSDQNIAALLSFRGKLSDFLSSDMLPDNDKFDSLHSAIGELRTLNN